MFRHSIIITLISTALPEDTSDISPDQDTLLLVKNSKDKFTVHWDPQSLLPMVNPSFFTVNLDLYRLSDDRKDWVHAPFLDVTKDHPNSGVIDFFVPSSDEVELNVYPVALRISVGEQVAMGDQD